MVEKIQKHCQTDPKLADYVFTTVHKSKGLEWQSVILLDDFREIPGCEIKLILCFNLEPVMAKFEFCVDLLQK